MKNFILLIIVAGGAYFGYLTWQQHITTGSQPETNPLTQQVNPTASAPGVAASVNSRPDADMNAAKQQDLQPNPAPKGTFFLLKRVSVTTDSGVFSAPEGTKVTLISTTPTDMRVTDGQHQFTITSAQVTNDLNIASQLANADRATQARLKAGLAQQAKPQQTRETAQSRQSVVPAPTQAPRPAQGQAAFVPTLDSLHKTYNKKHAIPILDLSGKIVGYNWVAE